MSHEPVNIHVGSHDVVATAVEGDEVGLQLQGVGQLLLKDGDEQTAADGEVYVLRLRVYCTEAFGNAVCPAAQAVRAAAVNIAHAFGEGVADCHVAY